jgi:hypothetical protein
MRKIEVEARCASIRMDAEEIAANCKDPEQLKHAVETLQRALANVRTACLFALVEEAA